VSGVDSAIKTAGIDSSSPENYRPISNCIQSSRETCTETPAAPFDEFRQLLQLPTSLFHRDSTPVDSRWRRQAGYKVDQSRSVGDVRHGRPFHPPWPSACSRSLVLVWQERYSLGSAGCTSLNWSTSVA